MVNIVYLKVGSILEAI